MNAHAGIMKLTTVVTALAGAASAVAQTSIESYHVQGNVHLLTGAGANVAVQVGDEGVLVVDTGSAAPREALLAAIRRLSDRPIRWIINTSADLDHTGGNETVSQAGLTVNGNPAAIISHENVLARIADLVKQGKTLAQVQAARPALDYDLRYGNDKTSADFVAAIYADLKARGGG